MIIIVEGPRGAGKSTLARNLHMHDGLNNCYLTHKGPPTSHSFSDEYILPLVNNHSEYIVCDRWHIGELVYPYLMHRQTLVTNKDFAQLESYIISQRGLVVHVDASTESILQRRVQRDSNVALSYDVIECERKLFMKAMNRTQVTSLYIDLDYVDINDVTDKIINYARSI